MSDNDKGILATILLGGIGLYYLGTESGRASFQANSIFVQIVIVLLTTVCLGGMTSMLLEKINKKNKRKKAVTNSVGTIAVIFSVALPIVLYLYFFWIRTPLVFASFTSHVSEYTSRSGLTATNDSAYVSGKIVVVDKLAGKIDDLNFSLPVSMRAKTPEEVATIVWLECTEDIVGTYVSGSKAYLITCAVTVIDTSANVIFPAKFFEGEDPPDSKSFPGDWHGARPVDAIVNYIVTLPDQ